MKKTFGMRGYGLFFLSVVCLGAGHVYAQGDKGQGKPLEITADESLEWHRNEKFFKATKNVKAVQGQTTLNADTLTARYEETEAKSMDIKTIEAEGSVRIDTGQSRAYGDKATYDIKKGYAIMKGRSLRLESPDQTVTATDRFEYWVAKGELAAVGRAKAVRAGDTLESDRILAVFTEDSKGQRVLKSLEAIGNVVITTQAEVLTGDRATYEAQTNIAEMTGNVKIARGPNVLEGDKANVDLNTNISRMFGSESNGGRVRGVFYPGSEKFQPPKSQ